VLVFVGGKMLLAGFWKVPTLASLLAIVGLLTVAVVVSILHPAPLGQPERPVNPPH